jgi:hypothetical protein
MKFNFSYQEKILRCSMVIFHYLKLTFKNLNMNQPAPKHNTPLINSIHAKAQAINA